MLADNHTNRIVGYRIYFSISIFWKPGDNKRFCVSVRLIRSAGIYYSSDTAVVITPFSHYAVSIAGGFIFGTWAGFLYNWIGRVIGAAIAFYLGRFLGRKIIKHVLKPEAIKKYDHYLDKGKALLFLAYFLPLFPDDELSYLAGFSAISAKVFLPLMAIGHISGSLSLAYLGNGIQSFKEPMFIILSLITLLGGIMFLLHYKKTQKTLAK